MQGVVRRRRALTVLEGNRRVGERRAAESHLHFPERRTGFDRREPLPQHPVPRFLANGIRLLRAQPWRLGILLAMVVVLSWLDLVFTVRALAAGASEANPVMAGLLQADVRFAAGVKLGATLGVVAAMWKMRNYRRILEAALVIVFAMLALMIYHIVFRAIAL